MVIPKMVIKIQNVDIFWKFSENLDLSSASHVCRMVSVKAVFKANEGCCVLAVELKGNVPWNSSCMPSSMIYLVL